SPKQESERRSNRISGQRADKQTSKAVKKKKYGTRGCCEANTALAAQAKSPGVSPALSLCTSKLIPHQACAGSRESGIRVPQLQPQRKAQPAGWETSRQAVGRA